MQRAARLGVALAGAAVALMGVGIVPRADAALDASSIWSASAKADAMAIEYLNTASPVFAAEPIIYGTPATARSLVDSNGQSTAIAAAPYPGDVMVGMPDNGNGAIKGAGGPGIFPSYPFIAQTSYPIKESEVQDQSGNRLEARSTQYASSSEARSGLITGDFLAALQAQASSRSTVNETTGELVALADSRLDAFKLTDALQIGRSTAHAKVARTPGQEIVRESSFTLGSIIVNGVELSYGDEGFTYGDESSPPPGDPSPLFAALKTAGISVEILPAQTTETSIESAGMKITQVQDYGAYQQRISFIIGRVSARIDGEALPAEEDPLFGSLAPPAQSNGADATPSDPLAAPPAEPAAPAEPAPVIGTTWTRPLESSFALPDYSPPDFSLPAPVGDEAVVPPVVEALTPDTDVAAAPPARREVRLAQPASVGKALRDDDYGGVYLGLGLIAALLAAGVLLPAAVRKGGATTAPVLKL